MTALSEHPPQASDTPIAPVPTAARRRWLFAAGVPTLLTGLHATAYGSWIVDDAGLSFAYARSLATGAGPVLQAGAEPVEGFSNPAWVAILVVGRWVGLFDRGTLFGTPDVVLFPKLVALLCCFGIFAAMYAIANSVTARPVLVTIIGGAATSAVPSFVIWTTSGLENALFALSVTALAAVLTCAALDGRLLVTKTAVLAGLLAALAALTRPDGIVYAAALPIAAALTVTWPTVRPTVRACALSLSAFVVPTALYLLWRLVTFGDYLPNTARAKEQGLPSFAALNRARELADYVGLLPICIAVAVVAVALSRPSPIRTAVVTVLVPLGLAAVGFAFLRPDWMGQLRFATPVWPLAAIVVTLSAVQVLRVVSTRGRVVMVTLAVIASVSAMNLFSQWHNAFLNEPTVGVCNIAQNHGYLFNGYADILGIREGTLLAVDGGGTGLTSRLRFVDLSGLADRHIASFWQNDDMSGLRDYVLDDVRPTFVKLFAGWAERERLALAEDPRFARDYLLMFTGAPGGGEWVRRDVKPDHARLEEARLWGADGWDLVTGRYRAGEPPVWWCGATLRPTPFRDRSPAPSPMEGS